MRKMIMMTRRIGTMKRITMMKKTGMMRRIMMMTRRTGTMRRITMTRKTGMMKEMTMTAGVDQEEEDAALLPWIVTR